MAQRYLTVFLILLGALLLPARESAALAPPNKTLTFAGDVWCPINCDADAAQLGLGVELLKKIYEPLGYQIKYVVMPWARVVEQARIGAIDGVIGALKDDAPGLLFPDEPLLAITDDFFVKADSPLIYNGPESLKGAYIGIIYDYTYSAPVTELLDANKAMPGGVQSVGGDDALIQNIRKLLAGRITVLCESEVVMNHTLHELGLDGQIKWLGGHIPAGKIYVAFSPASDRTFELRRLYDAGVARLRQGTALSDLYEAYHIPYGQANGTHEPPAPQAAEGP